MRDFEVIVVDDRSSDGSAEIAQEFAQRDRRLRFYQNTVNLGDYPNRMKAASLASGHFLKYVDSDDVIYPHALGVMLDAMTANPDADLGLSYSLPETEQPYPWKLSSHDAWAREFLGNGCMGVGPTGAIIKRGAFERVTGFRDWGVLSDTDLWYRLSSQSPLILLPPGLVWWRRHDNQEFTNDGARLVYLERGFDLTMQTLSSNESPLSRHETARAIERARQHHARRILSLAVRAREPRDALRIFRNSGLSARELARGLGPYQ
jgi:glycosyltransferase involved in cell wall biosynthesis